VRRLTDLIQTVVGSESLAIFTGSLPPGLSPDAWSGLLQDCVNRGAQVVVDTAGEPLRRAVQQPLWMIKPNEEELSELTGQPMESESAILDAARRLNERIPIVMVTVGRRGAYCLCEGHAWHAHASIPPESVKSTVGCGDAILAGFLSGLLASNGDVSHALSEGVAISVAATMTEEPARFDRGDVERIRRTVQLQAIT
jgi:fructose-1-phosphate kinase PfkB-like protein